MKDVSKLRLLRERERETDRQTDIHTYIQTKAEADGETERKRETVAVVYIPWEHERSEGMLYRVYPSIAPWALNGHP